MKTKMTKMSWYHTIWAIIHLLVACLPYRGNGSKKRVIGIFVVNLLNVSYAVYHIIMAGENLEEVEDKDEP